MVVIYIPDKINNEVFQLFFECSEQVYFFTNDIYILVTLMLEFPFFQPYVQIPFL